MNSWGELVGKVCPDSFVFFRVLNTSFWGENGYPFSQKQTDFVLNKSQTKSCECRGIVTSQNSNRILHLFILYSIIHRHYHHLSSTLFSGWEN